MVNSKPHHNGMMQLSQELAAAKQRIAELEKQRDGLVAENSALKKDCGADGSYRDCPNCDFSQYIESHETPATDAAIAEIGAKAVEDAAMGFHEKAYAAFEDSEEYGLYIRAELLQFANKLRGDGV